MPFDFVDSQKYAGNFGLIKQKIENLQRRANQLAVSQAGAEIQQTLNAQRRSEETTARAQSALLDLDFASAAMTARAQALHDEFHPEDAQLREHRQQVEAAAELAEASQRSAETVGRQRRYDAFRQQVEADFYAYDTDRRSKGLPVAVREPLPLKVPDDWGLPASSTSVRVLEAKPMPGQPTRNEFGQVEIQTQPPYQILPPGIHPEDALRAAQEKNA